MTVDGNDASVTVSEIDLADVAVTFLDAQDSANTILKFKVHNNLSYNLNYKYLIRFREFQPL